MTESNLLEMHHAYRLARSLGYKKNRPVDYCTMAKIIAAAYTKGRDDAMKQKKESGKGGTC